MSLQEIENVEKAILGYRKGSVESVKRNNHMSDLKPGEGVDERHIDAVLVDFMNYYAGRFGLDYGMYTADLRKSD